MSTRRILLSLMVFSLLLTSFLFQSKEAAADITPAEIVQSVSADNIVQSIQHLQDFDSRAFYLNHSAEAAAYIYDRFYSLGLYVQYQNFTVGVSQVSNVIAVLNGTDHNAPAYLFGAHYDSENRGATNYSLGLNLSAPGADDDASGVASVLELARILSTLQLNNSVMFVAFGAEEAGYAGSGSSGLTGSTYFVMHEYFQSRQFAATAILDMIGHKGAGPQNNITLIVNNPADPFRTATLQAVQTYDLNLTPSTTVNGSFTASDHAPFWWWGYPSVLVIEDLGSFNPFYHSANDTLDKLNITLMTETTRALLGALLAMNPPQPTEVNELPVVIVALLAISMIVILYSASSRQRRRRDESDR